MPSPINLIFFLFIISSIGLPIWLGYKFIKRNQTTSNTETQLEGRDGFEGKQTANYIDLINQLSSSWKNILQIIGLYLTFGFALFSPTVHDFIFLRSLHISGTVSIGDEVPNVDDALITIVPMDTVQKREFKSINGLYSGEMKIGRGIKKFRLSCLKKGYKVFPDSLPPFEVPNSGQFNYDIKLISDTINTEWVNSIRKSNQKEFGLPNNKE